MPLRDFDIDSALEPALRELEAEPHLEERLQTFLKSDLNILTQEEIYSAFNDAVIYLPLSVHASRPYSIDLFPVYRARKAVDEEVEDIRLWRTFSYPIPSFCRSNGRANRVSRPVLYCADHPGTAVAEIKPVDGDVVFLSQWMIRCHRSPKHVSIFPHDMPASNSWVKIASTRHREMIKYFTENWGDVITRKVARIASFLGERFVQEEAPYQLTSCLAHRWLYGHPWIDYLVYPSVVTKVASCNLAFGPNFADEFFRLDRVFRLRIHKARKDGAALEVTHVGENFGNLLKWRPPEMDEDISFAPLITGTSS